METSGSAHDIPPVSRARRDLDTIAPDGSEIRLLVGPEHGVTRASVCEVTLPPGQASRPVWHRQVEEIWYVLDGHGDVWRCPPEVQGPQTVDPVAVKPGDALAIPPRWRFQFRASRDAPLRILCFTSPPWPGPDEAQPAENGGPWLPTV